MNNHLIKFGVRSSEDSNKLFAYEELIDGNWVVKSFDSSQPVLPGQFMNGQRLKRQLFIGIQDKNGVDLYEGDIINFEIRGIPHGPEREYIKNAEIFYSPEDAMFCFGKFKMNDGQDYWYSFADNIDRKTIEIVGNIYEM